MPAGRPAAARSRLTDGTAAEVSVAPAAADARAARAAGEVSSARFEVAGTRSALASPDPHRHGRDAPAPHAPARRQIQHLGRYVLDGTRPPRHGLLQPSSRTFRETRHARPHVPLVPAHDR
ncbi:hypothetical protein [Streptomyces griseoviridis]|uniref:Uncharacterized protein n=1 Tax=Streptomyces griseoviridis TaxID=45398 RepID=A0ABT9LM64_STRGD|nr:hypothetical protein [Streptomyces griseoviridis]GGT20901.1 hypothetical protein GCM10010240_62190 [Streptomyces griseoviridis]